MKEMRPVWNGSGYENFFSMSVIEDWNSIPAEAKRVDNSESFKVIYRTQRATQMNHAAR
jgi:hypothetical protein